MKAPSPLVRRVLGGLGPPKKRESKKVAGCPNLVNLPSVVQRGTIGAKMPFWTAFFGHTEVKKVIIRPRQRALNDPRGRSSI
jgi:hypothetical protein